MRLLRPRLLDLENDLDELKRILAMPAPEAVSRFCAGPLAR